MASVTLEWDGYVDGGLPLTFELKRSDKSTPIYVGTAKEFTDSDVVSGSKYYYTLVATTGNGVYSDPRTLEVTISGGTTPPPKQDFGALTVTAVTNSGAGTSDISWTNLGTGVSYKLELFDGATKVTEFTQTTTTKQLTSLVTGKTYRVQVTASKTGFNDKAAETTFNLSMADFGTFTASASAGTNPGDANVSWSNLGTGVSYSIVAKQGTTQLGSKTSTSTSTSFSTLPAGVTLTFEVTASKSGYNDKKATATLTLTAVDYVIDNASNYVIDESGNKILPQ